MDDYSDHYFTRARIPLWCTEFVYQLIAQKLTGSLSVQDGLTSIVYSGVFDWWVQFHGELWEAANAPTYVAIKTLFVSVCDLLFNVMLGEHETIGRVLVKNGIAQTLSTAQTRL